MEQLAIKNYKIAIALSPKYLDAYSNLADTFLSIGKTIDAIEYYSICLNIQPENSKILNNIGYAFHTDNQSEKAIDAYTKAILIKPELYESYINLGNTLKDIGEYEKALRVFIRILKKNPHHIDGWKNFSKCLMKLNFNKYDNTIAEFALRMLQQENIIRPIDLSFSILNLLRKHDYISFALQNINNIHYENNLEKILSDLSQVPLLIEIMKLCPIPDINFEILFTKLRKSLLTANNTNNFKKYLNFTTSLASQCYINEYVFYETQEETKQIEILERKINNCFESNIEICDMDISIIASYRELNEYDWSKKIININTQEEIEKIVRMQITERKKEINQQSEILCLKPIINPTSKLVMNQYEENPYPRWIKTSLSTNPISIEKFITGFGLTVDPSIIQISEKIKVLVAGCGTGQQAIEAAKRYKNCEVTAIDLSMRSLSYALRKTKELGIKNIKYMQADILDLDKLEDNFNIIECVGVLHHMNSPTKGWKTLLNKLSKGGIMILGLYSRLARKEVLNIRNRIKDQKISSDPESIRKFRKEKIDNWSTSVSEKAIKINRDFFSMSECRDLFFHVEEHVFDLKEISKNIEKFGLKFGGFLTMNKLEKFKIINPNKQSLYDLSLWNKFELENTSAFSNMYNFAVQKVK